APCGRMAGWYLPIPTRVRPRKPRNRLASFARVPPPPSTCPRPTRGPACPPGRPHAEPEDSTRGFAVLHLRSMGGAFPPRSSANSRSCPRIFRPRRTAPKVLLGLLGFVFTGGAHPLGPA